MLDSLKNKINKNQQKTSNENISFDYKLFFAYHLGMMVLFGARPIEEPINQAIFAGALGITMLILSIAHKIKYRWQRPSLTMANFTAALLNFAILYGFLAFAAYTLTPNISTPDFDNIDLMTLIQESWGVLMYAFNLPDLTPWFLAGAGIMVFNVLSRLKQVTIKQDEFKAQCKVN